MGNRHLRRETKPRPNGKGKAARRSRNVSARSAAAVPAATKAPEVEVTPEERSKLVEDLAYFNVCIYREASSGDIRKDDIERAEQDIVAAIRHTL